QVEVGEHNRQGIVQVVVERRGLVVGRCDPSRRRRLAAGSSPLAGLRPNPALARFCSELVRFLHRCERGALVGASPYDETSPSARDGGRVSSPRVADTLAGTSLCPLPAFNL